MLARLGEHHARNLAAAAETTHRLRTPLATLRAEAELALTEDDPAQMRDALRSVVSDADRLGAIIDRLLRIGSSGSLPRPIDAVVADLRPEWERQARTAGAELELHSSGTGHVDTQLLRAVVEPLVENALAYGEQGSTLTIRISANERLDAVVDNVGGGVPAEIRASLFEPWVSGTPGRSGLGLWLARETAREAGGDVTCDEFGPGMTRFSAHLPLS
jgi:signal transduction histidine kinase